MITADKTFLRSHYKKKRFSLTNHEVDDFLLSLNKQKFLEVTRSGLLGMGTGQNFLISESETTIEY